MDALFKHHTKILARYIDVVSVYVLSIQYEYGAK